MEKREVKKIENVDPIKLKELNDRIFRETKEEEPIVEIEEEKPSITK